MKHALVKMKSESDYIIADCEKSENELTETIAKFSDEGDEMKDRIVKLFEEARQKMLTEANQFKAKVCMQICERQTAANQIKTQINQILPIYSAILEHGTPEQKYIFLKKTEEQQTAIATQIDEHIKAQVTTNCSLSFSVELLALLKMKNPIFQMNFEQRSSHIEDHGADNVCSQIRPVTLELLVSVDLTKNGDDKQEPHITGLDFMPDGRLVTVDANNNKCIILNERLQRQGTPYKFKSKPYDVVCVSENHIAVTVANMTLCLLSVSPDHVISLTKKIYTSSKFYSVCCLTPTDLVVSTIGEPTPAKMIPMMTIDTEGSDLKNVVFPRKTYKAGESKCTYVQSKNTLVLTDRYAHVVYIYDTVEGTSKAVTDKTIQKPCGVCVGPGDTVLVCCKDTNSIVRLSVEGEILGTYPVNMALPYTVCMSKDALTMAVSNNGKFRKKKLQLFKLLPT